jgi:predicted nuclease with TOPRIM domain
MATDAQSLKDIVTSFQEKQASSFQEKIQNIKERLENLYEQNNKELDKIYNTLTKLDDRQRSIESSNIKEQQKLQSHIDQYKLDLARLEKRLNDANTTIETLKQWRYIQLGAVGVTSAIITVIIGAAIAYITKQL